LSPLSSLVMAFNFFFWGSIENTLYVPPFHTSLAKLSGRMRASSDTFSPGMFKYMLKERAQLYDLAWDAYVTRTEHLLTKKCTS